MNPKERAAQAAMACVEDGMVVGLGTGSTADYFLAALGQAARQGKLSHIRGVPTSQRSEARAREFGIPLTDLSREDHVDVTIDGADEVDPQLNLIKGLGGALLREKIVAQNSRRLIIIVDAGKIVRQLGTRTPLPVEVATFGHESQRRFLESLGAKPTLRQQDGKTFITDNGNFIYDCLFPGIADPATLESQLRARAGIVGTGLFIGMANTILIGSDNGVEARE